MYCVDGQKIALLPEVSFVAIKNGMHQDEGFVFFTPGFSPYAPGNFEHCSQIGLSIKKYFHINN